MKNQLLSLAPWTVSGFLVLVLPVGECLGQGQGRASEGALEDTEATTPVITNLPETEELGGTVETPEVDPDYQDVPEPPAIPTEIFIPEPSAVSADELTPEIPQDLSKNTSIVASWQTQKDARTLLLTVPAARGQIVDRNGYCIANNKVGFYYAIQFPRWDNPADAEILAYARKRIEFLDKRDPESPWEIKDEEILAHYKNRRWIPLLCPRLVKRNDWGEIQKEVMEGIKVQPTYYRSYPHETLGAHFMGYVQKRTRRMPTGPISIGEPVTMELVGRTGLEKTFDKYLTGKSGEINVIFDGDGNKLSEEVRRNPTEGSHVVLTIEREFQRIAESVLRSRTRAGALVVMDVWDGDIIAMASHPTYNPNSFVPAISQEDYKEFLDDKRNPLFARAYQGQYPPASTFKVAVALAALETDKVGPSSKFVCDSGLKIDGRWFPNWHKGHEGPMDVRRALKRSCNPYFYRVGQLIKADPIISMASRLGFGAKVGLPVEGEGAGVLPTHDYMKEFYGYRLIKGALASFSIGQGKLLATPVQIARSMCAVANGKYLPKARLVKHIQDLDGNIVEAFPIEQLNTLNVNPGNLKAVHAGMRGVVADGDGTGKRAGIKYCQLVGKTGTGQWSKTRNVALFAGFVPAVHPEYAFVAVYEGSPGQGVSGGRQAAPMIASAFSQIYAKKKARGDKIGVPRGSGSPNRDNPPTAEERKAALASESNDSQSTAKPKSSSTKRRKSSSKPKSKPKPKAKPTQVRRAQPAEPPKKKRESLFRRWFKKR